jgi:phage tail-like protein
MPVAERKDHRLNLNFKIEIDGIAEAQFTRVKGLEQKRDVYEYHEGGENTHMLKFPGHAIQSEITLERGYIDSDSLFKWLSDSIEKNERLERKSGSIILLDETGNEIKRWNFQRAFPVGWKVPELTAQKTTALVESLTLVHEGLELVS